MISLASLTSPAAMPYGVLAFGALCLTLVALRMDRRRGIGPASFVPWDFLMMGGALGTLILTVLWLRAWLAG
jgi:hypothetical protein